MKLEVSVCVWMPQGSSARRAGIRVQGSGYMQRTCGDAVTAIA